MMFDGVEIPKLAITAFLIAVVFLILRHFKQNGVTDKGKRLPPLLPVLPILGAILRGGITMLPTHFMRSSEKLGSVFSVKIGRRLVLVFNGYETIFDALVKHSEAFVNRDSMWVEENIVNQQQRGVIFAPYNDAYKKYHKMSLSILTEFGLGVERVMETRIMQEVESLNEKLLQLNGRPFDPKWPFTLATSNVVLRIVFGKTFLESSPEHRYMIVKSVDGYVENMDITINMAPFLRFLPFFRRKVNCLQKFHQTLLNSIEVGVNFIKSNDSEATFIGRFLEMQGTNYNHQDLLYVVRDLCFGGTDTVSTFTLWAMVEMANNPEMLIRLQREIDEVVPGNRFPSLDEKQRMPYTEAVLLEVLRRHTIAAFFVRHTSRNDIKILEYDIPPDCAVMANCYSAHMDPKFWKDPETFRPERFLDGNSKIINSQRVIAFGLGKRSCLGEILGRQSIFLFFTSLVQRFDIRPPEGQISIHVTDVVSVATAPSHFEVRLIPRRTKISD